MRILALVLIFTSVCSVMKSDRAFAYGTEDEMMRASIAEAIARSRDFKAQRDREQRAYEERERAAGEMSILRRREEETADRERREYISRRPSPEVAEQQAAREEREFDKQKAIEDERDDRERRAFILKRDYVHKTLEQDAPLDEAKEYDL